MGSVRSPRPTLSWCALALVAALAAAPAALAAVDRPVRIKNNTYSPDPVSVASGDSITWRNDDSVAHTATDDGGTWSTSQINPGQSVKRFFNTPGIYTYHCQIHSTMKGTVRVSGQSGTTTTTFQGTSSTTASSTTTTSPTTSSTTTSPSTTTTLPTPPSTFAFEPLPEESTTTTTTEPVPGEQAAPPSDPASDEGVPTGVAALAAVLLLGTSAAAMTLLGRAGVR